jgi:hypothetical protein
MSLDYDEAYRRWRSGELIEWPEELGEHPLEQSWRAHDRWMAEKAKLPVEEYEPPASMLTIWAGIDGGNDENHPDFDLIVEAMMVMSKWYGNDWDHIEDDDQEVRIRAIEFRLQIEDVRQRGLSTEYVSYYPGTRVLARLDADGAGYEHIRMRRKAEAQYAAEMGLPPPEDPEEQIFDPDVWCNPEDWMIYPVPHVTKREANKKRPDDPIGYVLAMRRRAWFEMAKFEKLVAVPKAAELLRWRDERNRLGAAFKTIRNTPGASVLQIIDTYAALQIAKARMAFAKRRITHAMEQKKKRTSK